MNFHLISQTVLVKSNMYGIEIECYEGELFPSTTLLTFSFI